MFALKKTQSYRRGYGSLQFSRPRLACGGEVQSGPEVVGGRFRPDGAQVMDLREFSIGGGGTRCRWECRNEIRMQFLLDNGVGREEVDGVGEEDLRRVVSCCVQVSEGVAGYSNFNIYLH